MIQEKKVKLKTTNNGHAFTYRAHPGHLYQHSSGYRPGLFREVYEEALYYKMNERGVYTEWQILMPI